jgi:hypothetical protein
VRDHGKAADDHELNASIREPLDERPGLEYRHR